MHVADSLEKLQGYNDKDSSRYSELVKTLQKAQSRQLSRDDFSPNLEIAESLEKHQNEDLEKIFHKMDL